MCIYIYICIYIYRYIYTHVHTCIHTPLLAHLSAAGGPTHWLKLVSHCANSHNQDYWRPNNKCNNHNLLNHIATA